MSLLTIFIESDFSFDFATLQLHSSTKIQDIYTLLNKNYDFSVNGSARLFSKRLNTRIGLLKRLDDYKIRDRDVLYLLRPLNGRSFYWYNIWSGVLLMSNLPESSPFQLGITPCANSNHYGEKMARKIAHKEQFASVSEMKLLSTCFLNLREYKNLPIDDVANIPNSIVLCSWSNKLNCWDMMYQPKTCEIKETAGQVEVKLQYSPFIWRSNILYALCINTPVYDEMNQSITRCIESALLRHFPKDLIPLITHYAKLLQMQKNSFHDFNDYYCAYFSLRE